MTFRINIELSGVPQGKGRGRAFVHKYTGRVTVMTPDKTRAYEAQLRYAGQVQMGEREPTQHPVRPALDGRAVVEARAQDRAAPEIARRTFDLSDALRLLGYEVVRS